MDTVSNTPDKLHKKKPYDGEKRKKTHRTVSDKLSKLRPVFGECVKHILQQIAENQLTLSVYELENANTLTKNGKKIIQINEDGSVDANRCYYIGFLTVYLSKSPKHSITLSEGNVVEIPKLDAMGYKLFLYDGSLKLEPKYAPKIREKHFIPKEGSTKYEITEEDSNILNYWDHVASSGMDPIEAVVDIIKKPYKNQVE